MIIVICYDIFNTLKILSEKLNRPEFLTTSQFIEIDEKWFKLMISRQPALLYNNKAFMKKITSLEKFENIKMYILVSRNCGNRPNIELYYTKFFFRNSTKFI